MAPLWAGVTRIVPPQAQRSGSGPSDLTHLDGDGSGSPRDGALVGGVLGGAGSKSKDKFDVTGARTSSLRYNSITPGPVTTEGFQVHMP